MAVKMINTTFYYYHSFKPTNEIKSHCHVAVLSSLYPQILLLYLLKAIQLSLISLEDWFQGPPWIPKSADVEVLDIKQHSICI